MEFQGKPVFTEEVRSKPTQSLKFDPRLRNTQNSQNLPPPKRPQKNTLPIPPKQNTYDNYSDAFKLRNKNIVFFSISIPKNLKMKDFNAAVRGGRVHLESFLGSKAVQLNHHLKPTLQEYTYDAAIIHVGINDIVRCKNYEELEELPNDIMKIAHTCQKYNIGKIFISSTVTCTRAFANIAKINEGIKNMSFKQL